MKIIIAPAKTMKPVNNHIKGKEILFPLQNEYLHHILSKYNDEDIMNLMKISYKQANKVIEYYHSTQLYPALYLYNGTVFKQLDLNHYNDKEYTYMSKHLNILSAYYGVLEYNSLITPYRLDMTMKPDGINLYDYWHSELYQYFQNENYIISLASSEFTKMLKHPHIIFIDFIIYKNNKPTRNGFKVKVARGKMLNYMIKNHITNLDDIKQISFDGYHYNEELSDEYTFAFIQK